MGGLAACLELQVNKYFGNDNLCIFPSAPEKQIKWDLIIKIICVG